jgi:hypothetical protein
MDLMLLVGPIDAHERRKGGRGRRLVHGDSFPNRVS